jgi:hypothetical protein
MNLEVIMANSAHLARVGSRALVAAASAAMLLVACDEQSTQPSAPSTPEARRAAASDAGAVYTSSNAAAGNSIIAFSRAADGSLTPLASYPTGGRGVGGAVDPLASQYASRPGGRSCSS